jgi:quinol monooxygenase YgiN
MFTICTAIVAQGELENQLSGFRDSEKRFTREIGVLERDFYQCIQQPHIIWSNTKWTSEQAHNDAAYGIMKTRKDDRIGSAYFEPGLYFEIFCKEIEEACYMRRNEKADMIVVAHGLVASKQLEAWNQTTRRVFKDLGSIEGLVSCRTFYNYYNSAEFVGFMEWTNQESYEKHRMIDTFTIEEHCYTGLRRGSSMLAAYTQFYCRPLMIK